MIVIKIMERDMIVTTTARVTSGSVNLPVKFHFKGDEWDDLVKTAVFIGSGQERDVALITDECAVPADVLAEAGGDLKIGVYGRLANGATVIPTIWGRVQYIYEGTEMSEPSPHDPEPDWTAQVQQAAATALTKATAVKEAAARGDFDGVSPEVTISSATHGHSVTITDRDHPEGQSFDVLDGASAYEQAVAGGYEGTEAQFNAELAAFKDLSEQAASSATAAASSATAAANSATAAAASATAAGNAQTAAEAAQTAAVAAKTATESARDTAISTLQTEGAAQKTAIQQKGAEVIASIPSDYTELTEDVSDLKSAVNDPVTGLDTKAPVIINSASGDIASFADGADNMPIKALTVNVEPIQAGSGDPSPDNVRPISGRTSATVTRTGKNLVNIADLTAKGIAATAIDELPVGTYSFSLDVAETSSFTFSLYHNRTVVGTMTLLNRTGRIKFENIQVSNTVNRIYLYCANTVTMSNIQLEFGSTATAYEAPKTRTTYTIQLGDTVYGGALDVTGGKMAATMAIVDLGTLRFSVWNSTSARDCYSFTFTDIKPQSSNYENINALSTIFIATNYNASWKPWQMSFTNTSKQVIFIVPHGEYATPVDFAAAMSGVMFCYELATPIEITLTPTQITTLLGTNNIWSDAGDVSVDYRADTKLYIDNIHTPTDNDMTADAQIASGKYFLIGGNLYKSTTVIPAGDTIIPGTNCIKTNLAEALNALNT